MIKFVDITDAYFPNGAPPGTCRAAYISTLTDKFILTPEGSHVFQTWEDVDRADNPQRHLREVTPRNFFGKE